MTARPLAITMGDPAGIGPEIIVKAAAELRPRLERGDLRLLVIGSNVALEQARVAGRPIEPGPLPQFSNQVGECLTFDELHRIKVHPAFAAYAIDRDDMLVMETSRKSSLISQFSVPETPTVL